MHSNRNISNSIWSKTAREMGSKLGKAGLITGIIGLSICAFLYISMVLLILIAM